MENRADRREARRFTMNLPLSILPWERQGDELPVNMRDVSYRGLYFFAGEDFEAGREIAFVITLPKDVLKIQRCENPLPGYCGARGSGRKWKIGNRGADRAL